MITLLLGLFATQMASPTPLSLIEQANELKCSISDMACLSREFTLRGQADQESRRASAADLGCADLDQACMSAAWSRVDDDNLSRLKSIVSAQGWPELDGEAARGAWLIAQHADPSPDGPDRAFRDAVIPMVQAEVVAGRLAPSDYARMVDRNALADGQLQPYGSNQPCRDGQFDRTTIDSVEQVDERRREIGMDIMLWETLPLWDRSCERYSRPGAAPLPSATTPPR